jgi:hypothetical protein
MWKLISCTCDSTDYGVNEIIFMIGATAANCIIFKGPVGVVNRRKCKNQTMVISVPTLLFKWYSCKPQLCLMRQVFLEIDLCFNFWYPLCNQFSCNIHIVLFVKVAQACHLS